MMNEVFYFLPDGTYFLLEDGFIVTPTDYWSEQDWNAVEKSTNSERTKVVQSIVDKYVKRMGGSL
jgi:hypothetical protein